MSLTKKQLEAREGKITASFLPALMSGDSAKILNEWRRVVGDPGYVAEDLSDSWPVHFGSLIEPYALDWHQRKTNLPLTRRGEVVDHPDRPYFCCTLDAYREADHTVIDCKAPGQWRKIDEVVAYYTPQMIAQAACVGAAKAALLIVHGGSEPAEYPVEWTPEYEVEVWRRVDNFHAHVESLTPPVELPAVAAPVKRLKIVDMTDSSEWAAQAGRWLQAYGAAQTARDAEKELKALVPADAVKAFGAGIEITRNRAGSLSLRESK